jgi:hypothetical protein
MQHFYSPPRREVEELDHVRRSAAMPTDVEPERIPQLIDALDCLLALWIAEATLEGGS